MGSMQEVQQQQIIAQYQSMNNEISATTQKIAEIQNDLHEHDLVVKTLKEVDQGRKCYRQVGDVLVERNVAQVLPAVEKNRENLETFVKKLIEDLEKKKKAAAEFAKEYKIEFKSAESLAEDQRKAMESKGGGGTGAGAEGNTGVLV